MKRVMILVVMLAVTTGLLAQQAAPAPQNPPVTQAVPSVQLVRQAFAWQRKPLQLTGAFGLHRPCPSQDDPLITEAVPEQVVELPHLLPAA